MRRNGRTPLAPAAHRPARRPVPALAAMMLAIWFGPALAGDLWQIRLSDATSRLNLRAEPSASAPVRERAADGTRFVRGACVEADGRRWCALRRADGTDATVGWAAAEFLVPVRSDAPSGDAGDGAATARPAAADPASALPSDADDPEFDLDGTLLCARYARAPLEQCDFGLVRGADGVTDLRVFWPDIGSRLIRFADGRPAGFARGLGEADLTLSFTRSDGRLTVAIGAERYGVPEALLSR